MPLVSAIKSKDERTSPERAAIEGYVSRSGQIRRRSFDPNDDGECSESSNAKRVRNCMVICSSVAGWKYVSLVAAMNPPI